MSGSPGRSAQDARRWRAVVRRDAAADGRFVTAVVSTGIYCRPSCPARRPRRDRVRFFPDPEAAEAAGFRACLRCRPREAGAKPHVERCAAICRRIAADPWRRESLESLARQARISPFHLQRVFRSVVGVTPWEYAEACRVERLKERLRSGEDVTGAIFGSGYGSISRVYEGAARRLGMTPGRLRRGGEGMEIAWTVASTTLGRALIATTARGVCAVSLASSDRALIDALRDDYPRATLRRDDGALRGAVRALRAHIAGRADAPALPLDVSATAFQAAVWRALRAIPRGGTVPYAGLAEAIGRPGAARAVGRACAANRAAVLIPCHRAVGRDGALTGYRWGTARKRALLEAEAAAVTSRRGESRKG